MLKLFQKKVAVLGFGIEGQDLCRFLLSQKAVITVFDKKNPSEFEISEEFQGINFELGPEYLNKGLLGFDIIFRSPAFKLSLPEIVEADKSGVMINSATKLFFDLCPSKIIGVTGTKGKGTTATLILQILKAAGKDAFLAWNIGSPMLSLLPEINKDSIVILELSSFQLQDLDKSPHVAVVLFISSEHLDYHKSKEEYVEAKANIVKYQTVNDYAILNHDDESSSSFAKETIAKKYYFSRQTEVEGAYVKNKEKIILFDRLIGVTNKLLLRGEHNWDNICAAITASSLIGADDSTIKKVIYSFKGLPHRLELVKKIKKVSYYNDSFSTVPETTIAAIRSFKEPLILIAGGSDKGSDYSELGEVIADSKVKTLILIGKMATKIKEAALSAGFDGEVILQTGGMTEIVKKAYEKASPGDVVLFSPACASFDMFTDYKDRGSQYKLHVQAL